MKIRLFIALTVLVLGSLLGGARAAEAAAFPPSELVGTWRGTTEIFGPFKVGTYPSIAPEDHQNVMVGIAESGVVTGRIGEAVFMQSTVQPNRGPIGRTLHVATDYIVRGVMEENVTPKDAGARFEFTIPFNLVEGKFAGTIMLLPKKPLTRPLRLEKTNREGAAKL